MLISYLSSVRIPSEKASGLAIARQCQAFGENGHEVVLHIPKRNKNEHSTIAEVYGFEPNFAFTYYPARSIYSLGKIGFAYMLCRDALRLYFVYRKTDKKPDLIYSRDQRLLVPFILFGLKDKCYVEVHTKHSDFLTKFVIKKAKKVVVISQGLKKFYSTMVSRPDIQVEPSGVYLEQFKNLSEQSVSRAELGLPQDKTIFSYVGKYSTMGESKGVDELIQGFGIFAKNHLDTAMYVVGVDQSESKTVEQVAQDSGLILRKNIFITTLDQSKFATYLNASDVLLLNYPKTEHYDKYMSPTKLFAYMAVGKPIITSDLESIRSIKNFEATFSDDDVPASFCTVYEQLSSLTVQAKKNINAVKINSWNYRAARLVPKNNTQVT